MLFCEKNHKSFTNAGKESAYKLFFIAGIHRGTETKNRKKDDPQENKPNRKPPSFPEIL